MKNVNKKIESLDTILFYNWTELERWIRIDMRNRPPNTDDCQL